MDAYGERLGPGATVGHYVVERLLGSGGMGRVFVAVSPTGRRVAMKVIREEYAADPRFRARFAREVEAARRVSGAYTASVIDAATEGPLLWMATLFVPGPSLADRVGDRGPLPEHEVRVLAYELAEALRDIHRVGLVHRDLKPSNILLTGDGPRVIDFGIARVNGTERLTQTDALVGTPAFMAPEQFLAQAQAGPAADVFALGGVLTYALTGAGPFEGDSPYAIAWHVVHGEPAPLAGTSPLHELIGRCLAKDPAARPAPAEILELLRGSTIRPPAVSSAEDAPPSPEPQQKEEDETGQDAAASGRRPWRRVALGAGTLVVSLTLGLVAWQQWGTGRTDKGQGASGATSSPTGPAVTASWTAKVPSDVGHCTATGELVLCESQREAVTAYDARTGKKRWATPRTRDNSMMLTVSPRRSLVIVAEGNNFMDTGEWERQVLRAVDLATGIDRWNVKAPMGTSAVLSGTDLVVGSTFGISGRNIETGAAIWNRTTPSSAATYPRMVAGAVLNLRPGPTAQRPRAVVERIDPHTGDVRWSRDLPSPAVSWAHQSDKDSVGIEIWNDDSTRMKEYMRFDTDGTRRASHEIDPPQTAGEEPDTVVFGPTWKVVRDRVKGRLVATGLEDGRVRWQVPIAGSDADPYIDAKGRVYVLRANRSLVCLDGADGRELWRSKPVRTSEPRPSGGGSHLTVRADGVVYAAVGKRTLAAFEPPGRASATG
ncbi:protein kinase [Streptomyces sp. OfavH-34-F]|uniref:protein kinase domain-containing protein n=1 Tax=Streptomyces sp. OfavH-34-F TaxID=2917760 RepID=UPI001EF39181|nr:protein kinase [Streptomyces sp. OfavH-34-F]MCG7523591.1 protein kinase [Streptomyces sp. OfavH-34-F]